MDISVLPIFRSDAQARVLAELFDGTDVELTIGEIARRAGTSQPSVSRIVEDLASAGMVRTRQLGRNRLVSADWDRPWSAALATIVAQGAGLPRRIGIALRGVAGVTEAHLFGSWAARHAGESGPPPGDIDLLVVGDAAFDDVREAVRPVEQTIGLYINPVVVSANRWAAPQGDPFLATVSDRPLVPIDLEANRG